jgi:hypothetical protein
MALIAVSHQTLACFAAALPDDITTDRREYRAQGLKLIDGDTHRVAAVSHQIAHISWPRKSAPPLEPAARDRPLAHRRAMLY